MSGADVVYEDADRERDQRENDRRTYEALTFLDWCRLSDEYRALQAQVAAEMQARREETP